MGQFVSQPITEKTINLIELPHRSHAVGEMQGYRCTMEDEYCDYNGTFPEKSLKDEIKDPMLLQQHLVDNNHDHNNSNDTHNAKSVIRYSIYGVFDGHGGSSTSKYLGENLPKIMKQELVKLLNNLPSETQNEIILNNEYDFLRDINFPLFMKDCFMKIDSKIYQSEPINSSGSTAVVALIFKDYLIVANSGDSRCILSTNGSTKMLSHDHKPKNPGECIRIQSGGAYVKNNRVNGILALSRAFGDFTFKLTHNTNMGMNYMNNNNYHYKKGNHQKVLIPPEEYQVTVEPDINVHKLNSNDEFLVLACDGIWDCYKAKDLIHSIRNQLALGKKLNEIVEIILNDCIQMANTITGIGFDNMTIIIIALHDGKIAGQSDLMEGPRLEGWYSKMKNRVLDEKFGKYGH